ncbi:hypothetical protein CAL12_23790 [Bordetella genomosp. 8]|uniref:Ribonuclease VapC n=1 Tax=Bordetella genomosp. 8 TaxID=1416806 RepID=A0A1W6YR10_9BORD|nr:type II toxin-antitoxin system VapC family toxin [Bordetella genomosp. 8]ARP83530.1 hypothetical protein CAL12_23790 [Bordetella genomosp. 8]
MSGTKSPLFMLDTDVCSYLIRGHSRSVDARFRNTNPDRVCISVITRGELLYGIARRPDAKRLALLVSRFLDAMPVIPWESGAADVYANVRAQLEAAGTPIGYADTMIAAHAIDSNAVLVTNNARHYERIDITGFKYESWAGDPP